MGHNDTGILQNQSLQVANTSNDAPSPQKTYFNQSDKRGSVPSTVVGAYDDNQAVNPSNRKANSSMPNQSSPVKSEKQNNSERSAGSQRSGRGGRQQDAQQKEHSIRELREKYNQLMKQSLERKASQR